MLLPLRGDPLLGLPARPIFGTALDRQSLDALRRAPFGFSRLRPLTKLGGVDF